MFDYFFLLNVRLVLFLQAPVYILSCACGMHVVVELENF